MSTSEELMSANMQATSECVYPTSAGEYVRRIANVAARPGDRPLGGYGELLRGCAKLTCQRENVYQHFKFTRTATRHVLTWGIAVPAFIAVCAWKFDVGLSSSSKLMCTGQVRLGW